ncbi:hypothetical protein TrST_g3796 [Triparma strigata]|uniref:Protein kinase domain-containing protein n=1 Tax=Triparma strigata TaxID=1606541 RepID=A0A9W7AHY1_9STRA|nr:hypothetical protein TrST_g3796 [Triparma strigata]
MISNPTPPHRQTNANLYPSELATAFRDLKDQRLNSFQLSKRHKNRLHPHNTTITPPLHLPPPTPPPTPSCSISQEDIDYLPKYWHDLVFSIEEGMADHNANDTNVTANEIYDSLLLLPNSDADLPVNEPNMCEHLATMLLELFPDYLHPSLPSSKFRVLKLLGHGSYGMVFLVTNSISGEPEVIKIAEIDSKKHKARFIQEFELQQKAAALGLAPQAHELMIGTHNDFHNDIFGLRMVPIEGTIQMYVYEHSEEEFQYVLKWTFFETFDTSVGH